MIPEFRIGLTLSAENFPDLIHLIKSLRPVIFSSNLVAKVPMSASLWASLAPVPDISSFLDNRSENLFSISQNSSSRHSFSSKIEKNGLTAALA